MEVWEWGRSRRVPGQSPRPVLGLVGSDVAGTPLSFVLKPGFLDQRTSQGKFKRLEIMFSCSSTRSSSGPQACSLF